MSETTPEALSREESGLEQPVERIPIHVSRGVALVWSLDDVALLRSAHHICGNLTGTLPQAAQQNVFLGLPLELLPEEVVCLMKDGVVYMIDDTASHGPPTEEELSQWNTSRKGALSRSAEAGKSGQMRNLDEAALNKRLERQRLKKLQEDPMQLGSEQSPHTETQVEAPPNPAVKETSYPFTIPSTSKAFSWYKPKRYNSLLEARRAGVWTYPQSEKDAARCAVFYDLWKNGHFMGNGLRFGGDWLVYPGDPLRFHSHFVATVFTSPVSKIDPMQIVAFGRLGTATKKSHLICGWDKENRQVSYYSIEWAGFG